MFSQGICYSPTEQKNEFYGSIATYYFLGIILAFILSSTMMLCENWPQMDIVSGSIIVILCGVQSLGMSHCFGLNVKHIKTVHNELQAIIEKQGELNVYFL